MARTEVGYMERWREGRTNADNVMHSTKVVNDLKNAPGDLLQSLFFYIKLFARCKCWKRSDDAVTHKFIKCDFVTCVTLVHFLCVLLYRQHRK